MKRAFLAAILSLGTTLAFGAEVSRSILQTNNNDWIKPSVPGGISAPTLNSLLSDIIDSTGNLRSSNSWTASNIFNPNPIFSPCLGYAFGNGASPITCSTTVPLNVISNLGTGVATALTFPAGTAGGFALDSALAAIAKSGSPLDLIGGPMYFGVPGAAFNGVTDDSGAINTRIQQIATAGGGILILPVGSARINSTINRKSYVRVIGQGEKTTLICAANPCVGQASGSQNVGTEFSRFKIVAAPGNAGATVLSVASMQRSRIADIVATGFSSGTILDIASAPVTTPDDPSLGPNTYFNDFERIDNYFSPATIAVKVAGLYGASPPLPAQVVTLNNFRDFHVAATSKCYDIIKAADTNFFFGATCKLSATGAIAIVNADDPAFPAVNNYVNSNKFYNPVFTIDFTTTVTAVTLFKSNWTFGIEADNIEQDINPTVVTVTPIDMPNGQSYCFRGKNIRSEALLGAGNLTLARNCSGTYGDGNWVSVFPSEGETLGTTATSPYNYTYLSPVGPLNAVSVRLPCNAPDGATWTTATSQTIQALTLLNCATSSDSVVIGPNPVRLAQGQAITVKYLKASTSWVPQNIIGSYAGGILGATNATATPAGFVGELLSSTVPIGSAVSLTTATPINVTSLSLTAGRWACRADVSTNPAGTTVQGDFQLGISTTTGALPAAGDGLVRLPYTAAAGVPIEVQVARNFEVTATTSVFAVVQNSFTTSTNAAYGRFLCTRRI